MSTKLQYNSFNSPIFNKNIDQALQECNRIGVTDVLTQVKKREVPGQYPEDLPSSFKNCRKSEGSPEKLMSEAKSCFPFLDTSAQLRTDLQEKTINVFKKRAVAKCKTLEVLYPLIDLRSSLYKSYWSTYHCCDKLLQDDKKITGKYCNQRWCIVCNRIRTAKLIEGYLPRISQDLSDPFFVTLTIPNVSGIELRKSIDGMTRTIRQISDLFRNRRNFKLKGIRKIECTYNARSKSFHPHLHLLVDGSIVARELLKEWLIRYPEADKRGQDIRPADENSLIELFKYSTKLSAKGKDDPKALDLIFKALYKKRIFQSIGLKKCSVSEDIEEIQAQRIESLRSAVEAWIWEHEVSDWVNSAGEGLTGCQEYRKKKYSPEIPEEARDVSFEMRSIKETISDFEFDIRIQEEDLTPKNINSGTHNYYKKEVLNEST